MNDAISSSLGTALPPQSIHPGLEANPATDFDQVLEQDAEELKSGNASPDPDADITPEERAELAEELETRVLTLDHAGQVDYFAERIEGTNAELLKLRRDMAKQPNRFERTAVQAFDSCNTRYAELSSFMDEFASGRSFERHELLTMQIRSHQIMQSVEILSKTVEQTVSGMKTIFQTNV